LKLITVLILLSSLTSFAEGFSNEKLTLSDGTELDLSKWKGTTYMIVNIATRCGFTGQLDELEKLYQKYKGSGFKILGIPSNDFGGQTPEGDKEVESFCRLKYGVSFPITKKMSVNWKSKNPFITKLLKKSGRKRIFWNFEKFLVLKDGSIKHFMSAVKPLNKKITQIIEKDK